MRNYRDFQQYGDKLSKHLFCNRNQKEDVINFKLQLPANYMKARFILVTVE